MKKKKATNPSRSKSIDLHQPAKKAVADQPIDLSANLNELSSEDIQCLVRKLQVKNNGLEIQNKELRRAQQELTESRDKYADLFDLTPVGYFIVDENGVILEANRTGVTMLGMGKGDLLKQPLSCFIARENQDIYDLHHQKVFETQAAQACEIRLVKKNGSQFYAQIETTVVPNRKGDTLVCQAVVSDVSKRKTLEKNWQQYEFIANISREFMTLIGQGYIYKAVNEAYCQAHNRTREEIIGSTVADVWGEERFETVIKEHIDQCFAGNEVYHQSWFEFPTLGLRYLEVIYYPHRNGEGAVTHIAVVSRDITKRKQAEEALRESEERYRVISELTSDFVYSFRLEPDGTPVRDVREWVTEAFTRITGFTPDEADARGGWQSMIHPDDIPISHQRMQALSSGQPQVGEYRIIAKDGEVRWVRMHSHPVWDETQDCVVRVVGAAQDITERKRTEELGKENIQQMKVAYEQATIYAQELAQEVAERRWAEEQIIKLNEELEQRVAERTAKLLEANTALKKQITEREQAEEALRESETKFRILAEMTTAAIFIYQGTQLCYVNPASEVITGYSQAELLNMNFWEVIHPDFQKLVKSRGRERQQGKPVPEQYELRLLTKTGAEHWGDVTLGVIEFEGKSAVLGTVFDITERKQVEEKLRESEVRYRSLFDRVPVGLYRTTPDGQVMDVNPALVQILGYPDRESLLEVSPAANYVNIEDRRRWQTLMEREDIVNDFDTQWYQQDGTVIWVRERARTVRDTDGRALYYEGAVTNITEQKRGQEMLQASETKFRILAETATAVILIFQGTKIRYVNPIAEVISGYSQAELLAMNFWEVVHPDFQELVERDGMARQQGQPTPTRYELKLLTKNGEDRWVDITVGDIGFEGNPAVLVTAFDITERRQAQKEALQLNQKLIALQYAGATIASSLDLEYVLNTFTREMVNLIEVEGCIIFEWDQATDTILAMAEHGLTTWQENGLLDTIHDLADSALAKRVLLELYPQQMIISQADINPAELTYMQTHNIKTLLMLPMEFQDRVVGLVEIIDSQVERIFDLEDLALAQFLANQAAGAIENARLYAQVQQEVVERKRTVQELRQSEVKNRALLDAIPDLMFRVSAEGVFLDFNSSNLDDLYAPPEKFLGKRVDEVMPPEAADIILHHIDRTLSSDMIQILEYQLPMPQGRQDFEARFVVSGSDEVLAIVRNITERKRTEQQLIRAERLAALGHLTATLAHEISNHLQAILSYLDLMLKHALAEQKRKEYLHVVHGQIERLNDLTQQVLSFAHAKPSLREQVSVTELVEQVLTLVRKQLELNNIQVTTDWREVPPILAAANQLAQVFLNLVINAIEAIEKNGRISIAVYPEDDDVAISFTNCGPPISPEILPTIFEPFFSTKPEGSGLGLWVSHNLVQQHGGTLTVENLTDDQGVIFTIKLPVRV